MESLASLPSAMEAEVLLLLFYKGKTPVSYYYCYNEPAEALLKQQESKRIVHVSIR